MKASKKRQVRDTIRMIFAILCIWLYLPHFLIYFLCKWKRSLINSDIERQKSHINFKVCNFLAILYFLHYSSYYRSVFYYRIGPVLSLLIGWWRPKNQYLIIPDSTKIGGGIMFAHPYCSVLNADSIGKNFSFVHSITLGKKRKKRPVLGDNVYIGAGAHVIGGIRIGNNVTLLSR